MKFVENKWDLELRKLSQNHEIELLQHVVWMIFSNYSSEYNKEVFVVSHLLIEESLHWAVFMVSNAMPNHKIWNEKAAFSKFVSKVFMECNRHNLRWRTQEYIISLTKLVIFTVLWIQLRNWKLHGTARDI